MSPRAPSRHRMPVPDAKTASARGEILAVSQPVVRRPLEEERAALEASLRLSARAEGACQGIVSSRRYRQTGAATCSNEAGPSGYCAVHEYQSDSGTRRAETIKKKYREIGKAKSVSPVNAMISLLEESAGNVEFYRAEVEKLERLVLTGKKEREEIAKMVVLYNEERDRFERYTADALRINLEARRTQITEAQMHGVVKIIKAVILGLGLVGPDRDKALHIAAEQMRLFGRDVETEYRGPFIDAASRPAGEGEAS